MLMTQEKNWSWNFSCTNDLGNWYIEVESHALNLEVG
jgi:hypothetical protein